MSFLQRNSMMYVKVPIRAGPHGICAQHRCYNYKLMML